MEIGKIYVVNGTIFAVVTWADIESPLKVILLLVSIGFTLHRWRKSAKADPKKESD